MATVRRHFAVAASPEHVWDAIRDVGSVHTRLAPGFVLDTVVDGDVRQVTFANGVVVRERIVTVDEDARRLVYAIEGGSTAHHNASFEVLPDGSASRVVWTTDVVPDAAAARFATVMEAALPVMSGALGQMLVSSAETPAGG
jgi:carbon monoxide dehydrogenase subunit G